MSLDAELTGAVRSAVGAEGAESPPSEDLSRLETEHLALCEKRRRLHESIDMMAAARVMRPDAAALLERYRVSERDISWRRQVLYRQIGELRDALTGRGHGSSEGAATSGM